MEFTVNYVNLSVRKGQNILFGKDFIRKRIVDVILTEYVSWTPSAHIVSKRMSNSATFSDSQIFNS